MIRELERKLLLIGSLDGSGKLRAHGAQNVLVNLRGSRSGRREGVVELSSIAGELVVVAHRRIDVVLQLVEHTLAQLRHDIGEMLLQLIDNRRRRASDVLRGLSQARM